MAGNTMITFTESASSEASACRLLRRSFSVSSQRPGSEGKATRFPRTEQNMHIPTGNWWLRKYVSHRGNNHVADVERRNSTRCSLVFESFPFCGHAPRPYEDLT